MDYKTLITKTIENKRSYCYSAVDIKSKIKRNLIIFNSYNGNEVLRFDLKKQKVIKWTYPLYQVVNLLWALRYINKIKASYWEHSPFGLVMWYDNIKHQILPNGQYIQMYHIRRKRRLNKYLIFESDCHKYWIFKTNTKKHYMYLFKYSRKHNPIIVTSIEGYKIKREKELKGIKKVPYDYYEYCDYVDDVKIKEQFNLYLVADKL